MLEKLVKRCVDINSKFCPCLLADTNHCTFCSRLQGKDYCDCNWSGVCILYEQYWKKQQMQQHVERKEEETVLTIKKIWGETAYWMEFSVSEALANDLKRSGSFVFLKQTDDPSACYFPVGIMQVKGKTIGVAVETVGIKSTRFVQEDSHILVRGPYQNGVLGKPWIDNLKRGKILLVTGGIGQAPAVPIIETLFAGENEIEVIAAPGKIGELFLAEALAPQKLHLTAVESLRRSGYTLLQKRLQSEPFDLVVSAGPDSQHSAVIAAMHEIGMDLPMAATNNAKMCCGEGICGSCYQTSRDGAAVKMCKCQMDFKDVMQD